MPADIGVETGLPSEVQTAYKALTAFDSKIKDRATKVEELPQIMNETLNAVAQGMYFFPNETRQELLPYIGRKEIVWQEITDASSVFPFSRVESADFQPGESFEYWGMRIIPEGLPKEAVKCRFSELKVGVVFILDQKNEPIGFFDLNSEIQAGYGARTLKKNLQPIKELFSETAGQDVAVKEEDIKAFLKDYERFFAPTGDFCLKAGWDRMNVSLLSIESKYAIWKYLSGEVSAEDQFKLFKVLHTFQVAGSEYLKTAVENPDLIGDLTDMAASIVAFYEEIYGHGSPSSESAVFEDFQVFLRSSQGWLTGQQRLSFEQIKQSVAKIGTDLYQERKATLREYLGSLISESGGEENEYFRMIQDTIAELGLPVAVATPENFSSLLGLGEEAETAFRILNSDTGIMTMGAIAWAVEVEGFGLDIASAITKSWMGSRDYTPQDSAFVKDFAAALRSRSRQTILAMAKYSSDSGREVIEHGQFSDERGREEIAKTALIRDAWISQVVSTAVLAAKGSEAWLAELKLPDFVYRQYRDIYAGMPEGKAFMERILEGWEALNVMREKARGVSLSSSSPGIVDIQSNSVQETSSGAETANTAIERAREESIFRRYQEAMPQEISKLDCGCWDARRMTQYFVEKTLPKFGKKIGRLVGVDICKDIIPNPYELIDIRKILIAQVGLQPDLIGQFDEVNADWSASTYANTLIEQIAQACSSSLATKEGGIFKVDLPFIEGQGSYGDAVAQFAKEHPELTEGTMAWKWEKAEGEPQQFMFFHYETLIKLLEDAGFSIENLPKTAEERYQYFQGIITNKVDIESNANDAFESPVWRCQGKPRITIVGKRIKVPQESTNPVQKLVLFANGFPVVEKEFENAA